MTLSRCKEFSVLRLPNDSSIKAPDFGQLTQADELSLSIEMCSDATTTTNCPVPSHAANSSTTTTAPLKAPWFKEACAEAVSDYAASAIAKTGSDQTSSHAMKAVFIKSDRLWDNGTNLTYAFMTPTPVSPADVNRHAKVKKTIVDWQTYANVTFAYVESVESATIRITFDANDGSWSFVGKEVSSIKSGQPTMNLGWISGDSDVASPNEYGVILHEFGHTLGLMHEHQSPVRGSKITLKEDAVLNFYMESQNWTKEEVENQILNVYNKQDISNFSELDISSIMMYYMPASMNEQGIAIPPNNELSDTDKAFMMINYPHVDASGTEDKFYQNFVRSLDIVGVDGDDKDVIVGHYRTQNWTELRYEFTRFCTETRFARKSHGINSQPVIDEDGCISEGIEGASSETNASRGVATLEADLWLPGEDITYSWVQGSLQATDYRKKRVKETFDFYSKKANLTFTEVPFDPKSLRAKIHIYFGPVPIANVTGWSKIGKAHVGYRQTQAMIDQLGGTTESSMVLSAIIPETAPIDAMAKKREERTLYHEIGHALGLKHEHTSPNTLTTDNPDPNVSLVTVWDPDSVTLYANRTLREDPNIKEKLDPRSTKYNHLPSALDVAFLGALYPARKGHVDDHFEEDIKTLGLSSKIKLLSDQRDLAFAHERKPEYLDHITKFRTMVKGYLNELIAASKPVQPSHGITAPGPKKSRDLTPPSKPTTGSFLDEIIKTLSALFKPTTGQLFALQFPGRFLQQDQYAWDTSSAGIYGQFVKPTVVNESEFRLVDQLYNVGQVIGAPNGINLSIVYEQLLNNLVPGIQQSSINMSKQQDEIRKWLMKDVPTSGWVKDLITAQHSAGTSVAKPGDTPSPSSGAAHAINASSAINPDAKPQFAVANKLSEDNKVNRMELAEALMQEYLSAKQAWELERDEMIKHAKNEDLNALTRRLAHITSIREAQLAAKHADAVVRGYSHVIRQYLGYMDIKSPAEILQDAKDALRESATSSLDGSMKIYPVQMQPIDWFQSLSTSFTMEDLTADPDVIAQQIDSKSKQLDVLNVRLAAIQNNPKDTVKEIQAKLDAAQDEYDRTNADLTMTYTSNVLSLAKTCIDANNKFSMTDFTGAAKTAGIAEAAFAGIQEGMTKLSNVTLAVTKASRAVSQLMSAKSLAEASDTSQEIIQTNVEITALTKDIAELTTRLQSLRYKNVPTPTAPADPNTPATLPSLADIMMYPPENGSSGGSRWQEVYTNHEITTKYTASSERSQATTSKTDVSLFFGSYHSENNESSSSSTGTTQAASIQVEVGFRATMVTVDRGGWFQPQFFKQSAGFHCIDNKISWSKWPDNIKSLDDLTKDGGAAFTDVNKYLLPAYPSGFIICKDITIKIHMSDTDIKSAGAEMEKYAASSAGILCFSTSSSSHSKASDKSYGFTQTNDGCVIRIPGPQILGYILQFIDQDLTTEIPDVLPEGFLVSDADYDSTFNDKPAHTINTKDGDPTNPATPATTTTAPDPKPKV